jgi:hypothetical protein
MMIFYWHASIIPYHIDTIFLNAPGGKVPVARKADIGLLHLFAVNKKPPATKFNLFALSSDYTF